ncbi:MAG TPA: hypothetical protein VFA15_06050 [Nitrososphaera sp.]|nr:hypothetical protein [Nitrososphaera sp.]
MPSDTAVDEFIEIYKKEFDATLTRAEAKQLASDLLTLFQLLARKLGGEPSSARQVRPPDADDRRRMKIGFRT